MGHLNFFFQAEDGIRDVAVTGVQTCALPISKRQMAAAQAQLEEADVNPGEAAGLAEQAVDALNATALALARSRSQVSGAQSGSGVAGADRKSTRLDSSHRYISYAVFFFEKKKKN